MAVFLLLALAAFWAGASLADLKNGDRSGYNLFCLVGNLGVVIIILIWLASHANLP
jgi:hypothetical protein